MFGDGNFGGKLINEKSITFSTGITHFKEQMNRKVVPHTNHAESQTWPTAMDEF